MKKVDLSLIVLLLLVSFSLNCAITREDEWKGKNRHELRAELKKICDALPSPSEFVKINTSEMIKPERGSYGFGYKGKIECGAVKKHYSNVLFPQGWKLNEENNSFSIITGDTKTDLYYYKDNYLISIECQKTNSLFEEKRFSLSCSWSRNGY